MSQDGPPAPHETPAPSGASRGARPSLSRRSSVLLVSGVTAVVLLAVLWLLPVPYVVLKPGPALNTLGKVGGRPLISVEGRRTYPTSGALDLTTVSVFGGPGSRVSLLAALRGWLDDTQAVVPTDSVFPPDQTAEQSRVQNQEEMTSSQEAATVAALGVLGIAVPTTLTVQDFSEGARSAAALRRGDVLLAVGGTAVPDLAALQARVRAVTAGASTPVSVRRAGREVTVRVPTGSANGRTVLGIIVDPTFRFPFSVKIQIEDIGGPSAGTMFALGIIDVLTPGQLTGGRRIAGTGTIDPDGVVGRIGGIQQKVVGARAAGAEWFLAPADECGEVAGHVPRGLTVVPVGTLRQARDAVAAIGRGADSNALPRCPGT